MRFWFVVKRQSSDSSEGGGRVIIFRHDAGSSNFKRTYSEASKTQLTLLTGIYFILLFHT